MNISNSVNKHGSPPSEQEGGTSLIVSLLQRMHPRVCLGPVSDYCHAPQAAPLDTIIPDILSDINSEEDDKKLRNEALQRLYDLTDLANKKNR